MNTPSVSEIANGQRPLRSAPRLAGLLIPLLAIILLSLGACQSEPEATATPSPSPTPTPDPAAVLRQAAEAMQALESVHFEIAHSGGPIYFDPQQTLLFNKASGDYVAPDAAQALVDVQAPGLNLQISTIAISEEQWITNPLTQGWEKLPPGWGFNPAILFAADAGWLRLLDEGVTAVSPMESTIIDGRTYHLIQATIAADQMQGITAGMVPSQEVMAMLWIEPETSRIVQLNFSTAAGDGELSDWLITFSDFNADIAITPPPDA